MSIEGEKGFIEKTVDTGKRIAIAAGIILFFSYLGISALKASIETLTI